MKAKLVMFTFAVALPVAAQTAAPSAGAAIGSAPAPGAASAPTVSGPAGSGTVTLPDVPNPGLSAVNPGGIIGSPPPAVGGTFSRPVVGAPNSGSILSGNPAGVSTASGFPPPTGPVAPIVTNTGIGGFYNGTLSPQDAATFPNGAPPFIGNVIGTNLVAPATNFPPRRALSVDLPPGAMVVTNSTGVPEAIVPAPPIVPVPPPPAVGAPGSVQSGSITPAGPPAPVQPARPAPQVRNPGARIPPVPRPR